jgi:hypothetical protein
MRSPGASASSYTYGGSGRLVALLSIANQDAVIRPPPADILEWYDLWLGYRNMKEQKGIPSPYEDLAKLVSQLQPASPKRPNRLTKGSEMAISEWCQRNGPLGILLARWESITLATQAGRITEFTPTRYERAYGQGG